MKIVAISDIHGNLDFTVPEGDVLVIAGDICPAYNHQVLFQSRWLDTEFREWLEEQPVEMTIATLGNHDFIGEKRPDLIPKDLQWKLLIDEKFIYRDVVFYGTPWQKRFMDWAYNLDEDELAEKWALIPNNIDVLITHSPPYGYGDMALDGGFYLKPVGSPSLLEKIKEIQPRLHLFGHIHSQYNVYQIDKTISANCSLLDDRYKMVNKPMVFEI